MPLLCFTLHAYMLATLRVAMIIITRCHVAAAAAMRFRDVAAICRLRVTCLPAPMPIAAIIFRYAMPFAFCRADYAAFAITLRYAAITHFDAAIFRALMPPPLLTPLAYYAACRHAAPIVMPPHTARRRHGR